MSSLVDKCKKIAHDKNKKQLIYKDAVLKVYDLPVVYFPKFFHPDPSVERQSGFLTPQINSSNVLGDSIYIPYFHAISKIETLLLSQQSLIVLCKCFKMNKATK